MQFVQPTGYPYCAQSYPFNTTPILCNTYPEIIGEGNVTSIITSDGSSQLLFLPTVQWRPCIPNPNVNNLYLNNLGAWFVRSVYNPSQPTTFPQNYQNQYSIQQTRPCISDCCLNLPQPGILPQPYQLKFHNDICTSTTDLQYFTPRQCYLFRNTKGSAEVQVETPAVTNTVRHHEFLSNKPVVECSCATKEKQRIQCECEKQKIQCKCEKQKIQCKCERQKIQCKCEKPNIECQCVKQSTKAKYSKKNKVEFECLCVTSHSDMSIEEVKSETCCEHSRTKKSRNLKTAKLKKSPLVTCMCEKPIKSDKSNTTYTDQGTTYNTDKCDQTLTDCSCMSLCTSISDVRDQNDCVGKDTEGISKVELTCETGCRLGGCNCKKYSTELWIPKTPTSRKDMITSEPCETGWCSGCNTETEFD